MFQVTVLKFGNLLLGWKLATKFQHNIPKGTWDVNTTIAAAEHQENTSHLQISLIVLETYKYYSFIIIL